MKHPKILFNPKDQVEINSGYGVAARYFAPKLAEKYGPENIIIFTPVYRRDHVSEYCGMKVVGGADFGYGENMVLDHYERHGCNMLLQVGDTWGLGALPDMAAAGQLLWVEWIAVDWIGMPKNITHRIKPAHKLIPFSRYGENNLRKAGFSNIGSKIWLGLNTDLWQPMDREDLPAMMNLLGYEKDTFNILIVGANQERKRIRHALEAVAAFRKNRPEANTRLYLHSLVTGERNFRADFDELGIEQGMWAMPDPYSMALGGFPEENMVQMFSCADILINVAMEGFGYPVLQAQAVGCPAIVLSEGCGAELAVFGIETPPVTIETTGYQMSVPVPNPIIIAGALEEIWQQRKAHGRPLRSQKAIDFVQENFSWDTIASQWYEVIDGVMEDRVKYCLDIPESSEELDNLAKREISL